ncbi:hypothetical protein GCK72_022646 [Caenorhabditis remanei]|uniref:Protein kinase domain-containing protein n=1 Tax=Caenorhabditis remanei TaxID=31234 RepID=A0A6A5FUH9_CAERE|nr:hypothetical protein GCK72_022646 [Caenorhabditis remanei]KAF1746193.1 hypothetical protein GCK72_022646 [Caenorhabditis remanei]
MLAAFKSKINICFVLELMQESLHDVLKRKRGHVMNVKDVAQMTDCVAKALHGTFCGTQGYMAPEIVTRSKQTTAVDCFSLGIVIHQCSQGTLPFQLPTGHVSEYIVSKCKYDPPVQMNMSIRGVTQMLVKKMPKRDGRPIKYLQVSSSRTITIKHKMTSTSRNVNSFK